MNTITLQGLTIDMDSIDSWIECADYLNYIKEPALTSSGQWNANTLESLPVDSATGLCTLFVSDAKFRMNEWKFWSDDAKYVEEDDFDAIEAFLDWSGNGTYDQFRECYRGYYAREGDYAAEFIESCGDLVTVPMYLRGHIDYESVERDMFLGGDIYRSPDGHVFACNW